MNKIYKTPPPSPTPSSLPALGTAERIAHLRKTRAVSPQILDAIERFRNLLETFSIPHVLKSKKFVIGGDIGKVIEVPFSDFRSGEVTFNGRSYRLHNKDCVATGLLALFPPTDPFPHPKTKDTFWHFGYDEFVRLEDQREWIKDDGKKPLACGPKLAAWFLGQFVQTEFTVVHADSARLAALGVTRNYAAAQDTLKNMCEHFLRNFVCLHKNDNVVIFRAIPLTGHLYFLPLQHQCKLNEVQVKVGYTQRAVYTRYLEHKRALPVHYKEGRWICISAGIMSSIETTLLEKMQGHARRRKHLNKNGSEATEIVAFNPSEWERLVKLLGRGTDWQSKSEETARDDLLALLDQVLDDSGSETEVEEGETVAQEPELTALLLGSEGTTVKLTPREPVLLGRTFSVGLENKRISRRHCQVTYWPEKGTVLVEALGLNPLHVLGDGDGRSVLKGESARLLHGQTFSLCTGTECFTILARSLGRGEGEDLASKMQNLKLGSPESQLTKATGRKPGKRS